MRNTAKKRVRTKRVDRRVRNALIRILRALVHRTIPVAPPDWDSRPHRVLYLRYDKIGDMILATGIIRAIAETHATLTVDVLASRANASVLRANPHVGGVVLFEKKKPWTYWRTLRAMRRAHYDAVIDTKVQSPSFTDALLMLLSGAPHRVGVAHRDTEFVLTIAVPPVADAVHYLDHSSALVAAFRTPLRPVALGEVDVRPEIVLSEEEARRGAAAWQREGRPRLLTNVSAGDSSRYWPAEHFVTVLKTVRELCPAAQLVITCSPVDLARAQQIADASGATVANTPGVRDAFAVVANSDIVLTADTSITHVASAFGKPAIVLFPRNRGALYGPYGTRGRSVATPAPNISALSTDLVIGAMRELLTDRPRKTPSALQDAVAPTPSVTATERG